MSNVRELSLKPSFRNELLSVPKGEVPKIWEKIDLICEDPLPNAKSKKKIKHHKDLFRIRAGNYRIFYSYGDQWVSLLGVRRRDTAYDKIMEAETPAVPQYDHLVDLDEVEESLKPKEFKFEVKVSEPQEKALPQKLDLEWLKMLQIPPSYFPVLEHCKSEEDLLGAQIPPEILERILDNLFPKPLEVVAMQPDLVVGNTDALAKFKDGGLLDFLLLLDDDQKKLTSWAMKGPTMVRGGAGTGKSTVALYRVKQVLEQEGTSGKEMVLFTTFTNALMAASKQLLKQLLTEEQFGRVRVATCDSIARELVQSKRKVGNFPSLFSFLKKARGSYNQTGSNAIERMGRKAKVEAMSDQYLLEEFEWIIEGRGLKTLEQYQETPRSGRGVAFRRGLRESVWNLYTEFNAHVEKAGAERFSAIRLEAVEEIQRLPNSKLYDYVIIDEAQDLSPMSLCMMAEICKSEQGLFFAADSKQSLYSRSYTWKMAHPRLQFKGRSAILKKNYRSTAEIDKAAFDLLLPEEGEALEPSLSLHTGPQPVLLKAQIHQEAYWTACFIKQMSKHLQVKVNATAVLVPTEKIGLRLEKSLSNEGLNVKYCKGRDLKLQEENVKILTLHSAKGLEFPIVVLAGLEPGSYPDIEDFMDDEDHYKEKVRQYRRLMYVGMTRAMRGLLLIQRDDCDFEVFNELSKESWHIEDLSQC